MSVNHYISSYLKPFNCGDRLILSLRILFCSVITKTKLKMVGLDLIQVTCFICWIACVDGQALYEEKCKIKIDQDVQQLYGKFFSTSFFLSDYVYFIHKIQNICIFVQI